MNKLATTFTAIVFPLLVTGTPLGNAYAGDATLEIIVDGISSQQGYMAIAVFASADSYKSEDSPIASEMVAVEGETVTVTFSGLASCACAIKIFHDVNSNGNLDTNLLGIPTEPFGFSNNAVARFGPPSFEKAQFDLLEGKNTHQVTLASIG